MPSLRRLVLPLSVLAALALPGPALAATCENGDAAPGSAQAHGATVCLINAERTQRGLKVLRESPALGAAAQGFAEDMVARGFFDHVSPGGGTMMDRINAAGWLRGGTWSTGENIAWGSGSLGTPASIVRSWMASPGHRANILNGRFDEIGLGIADGAPQRGVAGVAGTYVTDFGAGGRATTAQARSCARAASRRSTQAARKAAARRCTASRQAA